MPVNIRTAPASALVLAMLSPFAAGAAGPPSTVTAQAFPPGAAARKGAEDVSPRPGDNPSGDQTLQEPPVPTSPPPRVGLFPEFGGRLLARGIDFHGIAFDHFLANTTAGVDRGHTANLGAFRPAVDLDLERLIGLPGGAIHASATFFGLRSDIPQIITQTGGVLTGFQTTPAIQTNLLTLLTYEQKFLGGRLSVEAGRTNAYNYFLLPNGLDPFTHFSTTFQVNGDFPSPPYPNWGGRATYKVTPTWYVQGGAFTDNYREATSSGNRFGTSSSNGAQILAEVGQRSDFTNDRYPSNFELGVENDTRYGRTNLKGTGAPANALLQAKNYPGGAVFFMQGLKTVWRGAPQDVGLPANIAVYGSFDIAADKPQPIDLDVMVGVNLTGFVPGRPFDALGLQAKYQRLSQNEADGETRKQRLLIRGGRNGPEQPRDGFAFELTGNIQATPAIAFRPIVQYFVNPDNYYPPAPPGRPRDGFMVGFFAVTSIGRLLGTSVKPF